MKINELKYERKFSLGNYEMETILAGASVEDGENPSDVLMSLMEFVNSKGGVSFQKDPTPAAKETPAPVKEKKEKKMKETSELVEKTVEALVETKVLPPEEDMAQIQEQAAQEKIVPKEEKPAAKVKVKGAPTKYNRETELHKKLVSEMLDSNVKGWKSRASVAKTASVRMNGEDFLDSEGKVLKSFVDKFVEEMK